MTKTESKADGRNIELRVGVDLEKISRFRAHNLEKEGFGKSIFGAEEIKGLKKYSDPYPHAAGIFCAKEAVRKALSYFKKKVFFNGIKIGHGEDGRPLVRISGIKDVKCQVSITHTGDYALAVALCEKSYESGRDKRKN